MQVKINMDNLESMVQETLGKSIEGVIKEQVEKTVQDIVDKNYKDMITETASIHMQEYLDDYIKNAEISVGGGFYNDEESKTYKVAEYLKHELGEIMKNKSLKIKREDRYSNKFKEVSFEDFCKDQFDVEPLIKKELTSFMTKVRKEINDKVNDAFTNTTKTMLSETVFNILMQNDTFQKINDNVKLIATKE